MWQYGQGESLIHYGVKGRSGKPGAGLWYKNGVLTEEGKRHYYGDGNGNSRKEKIKSLAKSLSKASRPMDETPAKAKQAPGTKSGPEPSRQPKHSRSVSKGVEENKKPKKEKPESATWKSKDARYLSDAELNRRNSRLDREKHYKDMTKSRGRKAASWIKKTASVILVAALVETAKNKMADNYKKTINTYGPKAANLIKNKAAKALTSSINRG